MHTPFNLTHIGEGLAFASDLEETLDLFVAPTSIIQAPPGSGKTTLVPPALVNHLHRHGRVGRVLVTAPRRIAVRAAAHRLSDLDGSAIGERSGFTIRGERKVHRSALVEFLTPGVLLRRLISDPGLDGVSAVIIDEVHERNLDTDLLIAMLAEVGELREDFTLVVMSATVDAQRFSELLEGAPVLVSSGEQHPVDVRYTPFAGSRLNDRGVSRDFLDHVSTTVITALEAHPAHDVLVFLPGRGEINHVVGRLRAADHRVEVLGLHSGGEPAVQRRILKGRAEGEPRRVIVSTDVAESSVTVPGVRIVVDGCLTREPRRDTRRGMSGLVTTAASHSSCEQRAGRAGRQGPGWAYRCIDEAIYAAAPTVPTPEILTGDITSAALLLACWGAPGGRGMALPDPFPQQALEESHGLLIRIGALLGEDLRPTRLGRRLAGMPVDPVIGSALLSGANEIGRKDAAQIVAMLSLGAQLNDASLPGLDRALRDGTHPMSGQWRRESTRLHRLLSREKESDRSRGTRTDDIATIAALGPGQIARWDSGSYLLESGTRAQLPEGSPLSGHEWLVITEAARSGARAADRTGAIIRAAVPIGQDAVEIHFPGRSHRRVDVHSGRVRVREQRSIGQIVISSTPVGPTREEISRAIAEHISQAGLEALDWDRETRALRGRLALLHEHVGDPWPDVGDDALMEDLGWLVDHVTDPALSRVPIRQALESLVWDRSRDLARLAPERVTVPSGRSVRLQYDYPPTGTVRASVKLQECFGMRTSPTIAGGRIPVTIELLSPANRPLAVTQDLEFFWTEVYSQVRAENRARYAKHPWPEDPWTHEATRFTNRQLDARRR